MLSNYIEAGDAIDRGLKIKGEAENKDLLKLKRALAEKIRKARLAKQKRERARAERISRVKEVWKWCKKSNIRLGSVPLVSTVSDDGDDVDDNDDSGDNEARWHNHHPHTGKLPRPSLAASKNNEWTWPCLFVYPSHHQSDFVESFGESDMLAVHMAQVLPELEEGETETAMPWDYNNIFTCSNLAVYFEVHCTEKEDDGIFHPEYVQPLIDQKSAMRFYESSRALKGDEGEDMAYLARCVERRNLYRQRKAWKKRHGSLWSRPDPCPVVRVHPAVTLRDVLIDKRMVVPNVSYFIYFLVSLYYGICKNLSMYVYISVSHVKFLVTFILFPLDHPAHEQFLKQHKCLGLLESSNRD